MNKQKEWRKGGKRRHLIHIISVLEVSPETTGRRERETRKKKNPFVLGRRSCLRNFSGTGLEDLLNSVMMREVWSVHCAGILTASKGRFTHSMPRPCRSSAMPCRYGFRMCLSHLIYTVRPCLIHICHAMLRPCRSSQGHSTTVERRPCYAVFLRRTAWSEHGMGMAWQVWIRHGRTV